MRDNWALLYAQQLARQHNLVLRVVFVLVPKFLEATLRQFDFLLKGLKEVESDLRGLHIPFHLQLGFAYDTLPPFIRQYQVGAVVCDFNPLRANRLWKSRLVTNLRSQNIHLPVYEVDTHNIVPVWITSNKQEWAARTIRPKIHRFLNTFLERMPPVLSQRERYEAKEFEMPQLTNWDSAYASLEINRDIGPVTFCRPGENAARQALERFIQHRLPRYADKRNDPNHNAQSGLSPYLHFGQLYAGSAFQAVNAYLSRYSKSVNAFIEEAVVRRELSDNYCYYNPNYDTLDGAVEWARRSIEQHQSDKREFNYSLSEFEFAVTHDDLWNASQLQLIKEGKLHGFLRMYWAKMVLLWSHSAEFALATLIYLNDKYEIDGTDPNGYVGCQWSVTGLHDTAWSDRPIIGKVRYMNYAGCNRKFNVTQFVDRFPEAIPNSSGWLNNKEKAEKMGKE